MVSLFRVRPNNILGFLQVEVYYTKSTDGGNTWETPENLLNIKGMILGPPNFIK